MTARVPTVQYRDAGFFNLRALRDGSEVARLAPPEAKAGLQAFLDRYRGQTRPPDLGGAPLTRLRAFLGAPGPFPVSRFSDGSWPVVYLGDREETCLREVGHHLAGKLADTAAEPGKAHYFVLASFILAFETPDLRRGFPRLHLKDDWRPAQAFGAQLWAEGAQGLTSRSVRRPGAIQVAVFRPSLVKSGRKLRVVGLRWNGHGLEVF